MREKNIGDKHNIGEVSVNLALDTRPFHWAMFLMGVRTAHRAFWAWVRSVVRYALRRRPTGILGTLTARFWMEYDIRTEIMRGR